MPVVGDNGANARVRTPAAASDPGRTTSTRSGSSLDDLLAPLPTVNVGDHFTRRDRRRARLQLRQLLPRGHDDRADRVHDGVTAGDDRRRRRRTSSRSRRSTSRTSPRATRSRSSTARRADREQPALARPDRGRGGAGQQRRHRQRHRRRERDARSCSSPRSRPPAARPTTYREIDPVNDQDGGEPGGNIRQVFLFRTDRGLAFVDRPGGDLDHAERRDRLGQPTQLRLQPGPDRPDERGLDDAAASRSPASSRSTATSCS